MKRNGKVRKVLFMLVAGLSSAQLCLGMENKSSYQVGMEMNRKLIHIPTEDELNNFFNELMAIDFQNICKNIEKDLKLEGIEPNFKNISEKLRLNDNNFVIGNATNSNIVEMSKKYKAWSCRLVFEYFRRFLEKNNIPCLQWMRFEKGNNRNIDNHVAAVCLCRRNDGNLNLVCLNASLGKLEGCNIPELVCKIDDVYSYTLAEYKKDMKLYLIPCNFDNSVKDHAKTLCKLLFKNCKDDSFLVMKLKPSKWVQLIYCWSLQNNKFGSALSSEFNTAELLTLAQNINMIDKYYESGFVINNI